MKRRPVPPDVDLAAWHKKRQRPHEQNRLVLEWLSHDERRAKLYTDIRNEPGGLLRVPSHARHADDDPDSASGAELTHEVWLVAKPELVRDGLMLGDVFGNAPYRRLGSGEFLLGMDPQGCDPQQRIDHEAQGLALKDAFGAVSNEDLRRLARWCSRAALTTLAGTRHVDAAALAEHAALRFSQVLFGYATADFEPMREALADAYRAMNVQMLARHFVTEPAALPLGAKGMAWLAQRAGVLMADYALGHPDWPPGVEEAGGGLPCIVPILQSLARHDGRLDSRARAVLVVGALAGTVGNIQAASCIALQALLASPKRLADARAALVGRTEDVESALWLDHVAPALRPNPPAPFLPRRLLKEHAGLPQGADCILCVGSATLEAQDSAYGNALLFGIDAGAQAGLHGCLGAHLARLMVCQVVAEIVALPGLEERLDDNDGDPLGLSKRWGFGMESYPLVYRRDRRVVQQPLNVAMRVRQPQHVHGPALRAVIRSGAPRIERLLREARHVHFAWFEFLEDDHVLALHTVFDGDFEAYLQHFALKAGDLFDLLFEHIETPPPRPVKDHPEAFVRHILAHHRGAAEGYFFTAYPKGDTQKVLRYLPEEKQ